MSWDYLLIALHRCSFETLNRFKWFLLQSFTINSSGVNRYYKVIFKDSTDFYGRAVVYHLQLYGTFDQESL